MRPAASQVLEMYQRNWEESGAGDSAPVSDCPFQTIPRN